MGLSYENLEAVCDALVQPKRRASKEHLPYEPHIVVGTCSVSTEQKISLAFAGYVAGEMRRYRPPTGILVLLDFGVFYDKIGKILVMLKFLKNHTERFDDE